MLWGPRLVSGIKSVKVVLRVGLLSRGDGAPNGDGAVAQGHDRSRKGHHPQAVEVGALQQAQAWPQTSARAVQFQAHGLNGPSTDNCTSHNAVSSVDNFVGVTLPYVSGNQSPCEKLATAVEGRDGIGLLKPLPGTE